MIRPKKVKVSLFLLCGLLIAQIVTSLISAPTTNAVRTPDERAAYAKKVVAILAVRYCILQGKMKLDINDNEVDDASNFNNWGQGTLTDTYAIVGDADRVTMPCSSIFPLYANFSSEAPRDFLYNLGYTVTNTGLRFNGSNQQLADKLIAKYSDNIVPSATSDDVAYYITEHEFNDSKGCSASNQGLANTITDPIILRNISGNGQDPNAKAIYSKVTELGDGGSVTYVYSTNPRTGDPYPLDWCRSIADKISSITSRIVDTANKEAAQQKKDTFTNTFISEMCGAPSVGEHSGYADCVAKYTKALTDCVTGDVYVPGIPIPQPQSQADIAKCIVQKTGGNPDNIGAALKDAFAAADQVTNGIKADNTGAACSASDNSCNIKAVCTSGALGWFLCPLATLLNDATTKIADMLSGWLAFKPLLISGDSSNAMKAIWSVVLNIANLLMVIVFLVIVFSQATSVGLSAYGIKKMLPKLVIAAVLVNLSFYICAFGIDISNILGESVKSIMKFGFDAIKGSTGLANTSSSPDPLAAVTDIVVASMAAAIAGAVGALPLLLPVLITGVLAFFTAWAVVGIRIVLLTLIVIVSPVAFVAMVLPNTAQLFTRWRKLFVGLLMMYPVLMAIFYGSALVSAIILANNN